jgi:hypothetical protein
MCCDNEKVIWRFMIKMAYYIIKWFRSIIFFGNVCKIDAYCWKMLSEKEEETFLVKVFLGLF